MATLNTLRTKFGIVLSAVIAIALLAFVFSLKSEMGFSGDDPIVLKIDGQGVSYSEYLSEYETIKSMSGMDESTEQQVGALSNATLQSFVTSKVVTPGLEELGISVGDVERMAMIRGEIPTQALYSAFADPATGAYDSSGVAMFLLQAEGNPEAESVWSFINEQAIAERESMKYLTLLGAGAYVNDLEVEQGQKHSNTRYAGRLVSKRYNTLPDSLFAVSGAEIKKYYDENIARYKRTPSRDIAYVAFDIVPTAEDKATVESAARTAGEEFAVSDDIRAYIRDSRYGSISQNFVSASQLLAAESEAFATGVQYGPILRNNTWRVSRPLVSRMAPDTLGIRLIALPYTSMVLADSLLQSLQGGGDFAQAAVENSLHQSSQMGGEMGRMPYSALTPEMADAIVGAREGAVVMVEMGDMLQILQVHSIGKSVQQYRVASLEFPVVASQTTINTAHSDAAQFAVDAKGSASAFDDAVKKHELSTRSAMLTQGARELAGIGSSREVARWAYNAKRGELSQIFRVAEGYIVAMLRSVDNSTYRSLEDVKRTITSELMKEKKFEAIKSEISGDTFDAVAKSLSSTEPKAFEDVSFASMFIPGIGVEPRVVGAISTTAETSTISKPVMGNSALYIFEVTAITEVAEPLSLEDERVRLQAISEGAMQQAALSTIQDMSDIEDLRGNYF